MKGLPLIDKNGNMAYNISAQISVTIETSDYGNMSPELIDHEKEHERIYKSIDEKIIYINISIHMSLTNDEICNQKKNAIWNSAMPIIKSMFEKHNTWDDLDVNNISEHRINVTEALMDLEIEFKNSYKCECE